MEHKKNSYLARLIAAFVLASILFFGAIALANVVSYYNYKKIQESNNLVRIYIADVESYIQYKSLNENGCSEEVRFLASEKLDEIGGDLFLLEKRFGKNDERVLEQKKLYSELEYRHYTLMKDLGKSCRKNFTTILFFYSNEGELEKESERMGFVLGTYKKEDSENRFVYSFDSNLNVEIINELKDKYNFKSYPIAVVNEGNPIYVKNLDDVERN